MDKKMHIERMWTDRVQERIAGIGIGTKKHLQRFWERLKNLFKRSSEEMHNDEDSKKS